MKKDELDLLLEQNNYLKGGTKKACVLVRDFLLHSSISNGTISSTTEIPTEKFVSAVKTLMAAGSQFDDIVPKTWHCDSNCKLCTALSCPGEYAIDKNSKNLCPYFMDDSLI